MKYSPKQDREGINYSIESPLPNFLLLLVGTFALVGVFVLAAGLFGQAIMSRVPASTERWIFRHLSLFPDAKPFPEGSAILKKLVGKEGEEIEVFYSCESSANAFAAPGRKIYVTKGLLDIVSSENALAFVLGHEFGHLKHRDNVRHIGFSVGAGIALSVLGLEESMSPVSSLATQIVSSSYTREQEVAADEVGAELVRRHYGGLPHALEFFEKMNAEDAKDLTPAFLRTHPLTDSRLEYLRRNSGMEVVTALPRRYEVPCESATGMPG